MARFIIFFTWILSVTIFISGCDSQDASPTPNIPGSTTGSGSSEWLIPQNTVLSGGPGKDGIPSIDNPQFASIGAIDYLNDDDLVIGVKSGDEVRAYPHPILDWHEIVNDDLGSLSIAITYCPLTGTAIGWNRDVNGTNTTFGVSGLLHNSNLIPYDRATDSNWSQMRLESVNGSLIRTKIDVEHMVETSWATWKELYPDSEVLTTNTGFSRDYSRYPYGDYKSTNFTNFPITNQDNRRHLKDRVLGVQVGPSTKAYPFDLFTGDTTSIIQDNIRGIPIVVIGNAEENFIVAFNRELNGNILNFNSIETSDDTAIFGDETGNRWNLFGEVVSGPSRGQKLENVTSYIGFWFAWATFNPDIEIYTP